MESVKKGLAMMVSSLPVVAIFFAYGVASNFISGSLSTRLNQTGGGTGPLFYASLLVSFAFVIVGLFLQAGALGYFKEKATRGTAGVGLLVGEGKRYFGRLFVFGLVLMAIVAISAVGAVVSNQVLPRPAAMAVSGLLVVVSLYFVMIWFLTPYAVVVHEQKLKEAMSTSFSLMKKHFLGIVGIGLILVVIGFLVGFLFGLVSGLIGAVANRGAALQTPGTPAVPQVVMTVFGSLVNAVLGVMMTATYMHYYLKISRKEQANPVS